MKDIRTKMNLTKIKSIDIQWESQQQDGNCEQYILSITPRQELNGLFVYIRQEEDLPIVRANKATFKMPHSRDKKKGERIGAEIELDGLLNYEIKKL